MSANLANGQYVNITSGEVRITALAQNSGGSVRIFTVPFSTPTGGISVAVDTILGRNREIKDIFNKIGSFSGSTSGNEILVTKQGSITLKDDFVYFSSANANSIEQTKSLIKALTMGDIFVTGGASYKVVGTNGVIKSGLSTTSNKIFGLLTKLDGRLIIPQSIIRGTDIMETPTVANSRITAYNKSSVCVMFEIMTKYNENKSEGYRFVYTLNSNFKYQEQDQANEISFDQLILSDVRYIDKFFYQGFSTGETGTNVPARSVKVGVTNINMFKAPITNSIVIAGGTGGVVENIPLANFTTANGLPTNKINSLLEISAYTPSLGDIWIANYTSIAGKTYYMILRYNTTGSKWEFLKNNVGNDSIAPAVTADAVSDTFDEIVAISTTNAVAYPCYDFDFEAEDFTQV